MSHFTSGTACAYLYGVFTSLRNRSRRRHRVPYPALLYLTRGLEWAPLRGAEPTNQSINSICTRRLVVVANFQHYSSWENSSRRSDVPVSNNLFVDSQASRLDEEVCIHPLYNKDKLMNMKNLQKKFSKAEFYSAWEETANRFHNSHHILPSISLLIFCRQFTVSFCTYR